MKKPTHALRYDGSQIVTTCGIPAMHNHATVLSTKEKKPTCKRCKKTLKKEGSK